MLAEAAAPAPVPMLPRTAGTRSWLDLARNGDLAGAAGVAAAEYNQMTATVADVTAKTRSGAAGTQDHDTTRARGDHYTTLAKVTQVWKDKKYVQQILPSSSSNFQLALDSVACSSSDLSMM